MSKIKDLNLLLITLLCVHAIVRVLEEKNYHIVAVLWHLNASQHDF